MTKSFRVQSSPSPYFKTPSDDKPLVKLTAAKKEIPIQKCVGTVLLIHFHALSKNL